MASPAESKNFFYEFINKKFNREKINKIESVKEDENYMSPGRANISALQSRYITIKRVFIYISSIQTILNISFVICIIYMSIWMKNNQIVTVVPGAPEVMKIRPGSFPDSSVYFFAETVSDYVGTFSSINVDDHYRHVGQYMSPQMRQQFDMVWRGKIEEWRGRKLDQIFSYQNIDKFQLVHDKDGTPVYKVNVKGMVKQYIDGQIFSEPEEKILHLEFKTKSLTSEKPWFFEITKFEWLSVQQFEALFNNK